MASGSAGLPPEMAKFCQGAKIRVGNFLSLPLRWAACFWNRYRLNAHQYRCWRGEGGAYRVASQADNLNLRYSAEAANPNAFEVNETARDFFPLP